MSIGERIESLRGEKQITQYQLAKLLEVSRQAVSKWENDLNSPDTLNLIRLADILDTDVEYLATGRHSPLSPPPVQEKIVEVERIVEVEKVVEKVVTVEKPVYFPVEKYVEVEKPVVRKVIRTRYVRNPVELILLGGIFFIAGLIVGLFL